MRAARLRNVRGTWAQRWAGLRAGWPSELSLPLSYGWGVAMVVSGGFAAGNAGGLDQLPETDASALIFLPPAGVSSGAACVEEGALLGAGKSSSPG